MAQNDTIVSDLIFNSMSQAEFNAQMQAETLDPNQFYLTPDDTNEKFEEIDAKIDETVANFEELSARIDTYSDTEFIAHQAMPSAKRVSLTPSNEGSYTAPADGYFAFFATATTANGYAGLRRAGLVVSMFSSLLNTTSGAIEIPARKGEVITLFYGGVGSVSFYFEYAQGATNE